MGAVALKVDITFIGDIEGFRWQTQPQTLNGCFGDTQAEVRQKFVDAWNQGTGESRTVEDFDWAQQGGPPE